MQVCAHWFGFCDISVRFCIGDGRMIGVASENNKKRIQIAYQGGVTRKVRFRNWYYIGSSIEYFF